MECSLLELHMLLKGAEMTLPNLFPVLIKERVHDKFNAFGKGKLKSKAKMLLEDNLLVISANWECSGEFSLRNEDIYYTTILSNVYLFWIIIAIHSLRLYNNALFLIFHNSDMSTIRLGCYNVGGVCGGDGGGGGYDLIVVPVVTFLEPI
ncbi:hypothetical protein L1987_22473 [Smallanthus sonchifolius]|uniref:Uncharacterized protein n=1 Tax=Smallanthus sonchifolius TaxID=185202 RepID=A0ACB9IEX4_9ASTR|nr:hypothetical protein L1987_22473 [Smallanthus sonchifolius]